MDFSTVTDPIFIAKVIDFALLIGVIWYLYQRFGSAYLVVQQEAQNKAVEDATAQRAAAERAVETTRQAIELAKIDAARMLETGKALDVPVVHVWDIRDGKLARFRQFIDTVKFAEVVPAGVAAG